MTMSSIINFIVRWVTEKAESGDIAKALRLKQLVTSKALTVESFVGKCMTTFHEFGGDKVFVKCLVLYFSTICSKVFDIRHPHFVFCSQFENWLCLIPTEAKIVTFVDVLRKAWGTGGAVVHLRSEDFRGGKLALSDIYDTIDEILQTPSIYDGCMAIPVFRELLEADSQTQLHQRAKFEQLFCEFAIEISFECRLSDEISRRDKATRRMEQKMQAKRAGLKTRSMYAQSVVDETEMREKWTHGRSNRQKTWTEDELREWEVGMERQIAFGTYNNPRIQDLADERKRKWGQEMRKKALEAEKYAEQAAILMRKLAAKAAQTKDVDDARENARRDAREQARVRAKELQRKETEARVSLAMKAAMKAALSAGDLACKTAVAAYVAAMKSAKSARFFDVFDIKLTICGDHPEETVCMWNPHGAAGPMLSSTIECDSDVSMVSIVTTQTAVSLTQTTIKCKLKMSEVLELTMSGVVDRTTGKFWEDRGIRDSPLTPYMGPILRCENSLSTKGNIHITLWYIYEVRGHRTTINGAHILRGISSKKARRERHITANGVCFTTK